MSTICHRRTVLLTICLFLLGALLAGNAAAQIAPCPNSKPSGPAVNCTKQITIYNYSATEPLYPIIEVTFHALPAGDNWLIALNPLNNLSYTYPTNNLYRAYVNPVNGIPARGSVTITMPWYSQLEATPDPKKSDQYIDWFNGGRVYLIDAPDVINAIFKTETTKVTPYAGILTCSATPPKDCEQASLPLYADPPTNGIDPALPNQNVEYTFTNVLTPPKERPNINDYNVDYDVSYVDTVYLPVALEPINSPLKIGYLGTNKTPEAFKANLNVFAQLRNWPYYTGKYANPGNKLPPNLPRPWLPGAYKAFADIPAGLLSSTTAADTLVKQWNTCTTAPTKTNCPDSKTYQDLKAFFAANYNNYQPGKCPSSTSYPLPPPPLDWTFLPPLPPPPVNVPAPLQYVYGWVPFNSGCTTPNSKFPDNGPAFNDLLHTPGFESSFAALQSEFIELQYNYQNTSNRGALTFNPFVELIHSQSYLDANSYGFSIDDAAGNQNQAGDGIYIAMGGVNNLPNKNPIPPPVNPKTTVLVHLGPPVPLSRPAWSKYGICKNTADTAFPGPNATPDPDGGFTINVVTTTPTFKVPCTVTMTDAVHSYSYQLTIKNPLPWKPFTQPPLKPPVAPDISCPNPDPANWCMQISETSHPSAPASFALGAPPPNPP